MRNYPAIIDRILERFQLRKIRFDDSVGCNILANLRQLIESEGVAQNYPVTNFYACWALHPKLDRNNVSQNVLSTIGLNLPTANTIDPTFIDTVCENLRAEKLRQEILGLGTQYGFRDIVSDDQGWLQMYGVLLNLVTEKPLCPPLQIPAGSTLRINPTNTPLIAVSSTIRLWLHGDRGQQAEWTIAIVPEGTTFDMSNLTGLLTFNGGVFTVR